MRTFKLPLESIVNNSNVTCKASIPCCQKLETLQKQKGYFNPARVISVAVLREIKNSVHT